MSFISVYEIIDIKDKKYTEDVMDREKRDINKKPQKKKRGNKKKLRITLGIIAAVLVIAFTAALTWFMNSFDFEPDMSEYTLSALTKQTKLFYYDSDNRDESEPLALAYDEKLFSGQNSIILSYDNFPEDLVNAFVSIEDKRFYTHKGIDFRRTVGAVANYFFGSGSFGGSTITQQVVKNVTGDSRRNISRKVQEMISAREIEKRLTKKQILELYLNLVNMAHGNTGVGAAAKYYFSKSPAELTLAECASIAAITSSPAKLDPENNPENNAARRNMILGLMLEQGYIDQNEYYDAISEQTSLKICRNEDSSIINSWYVDMAVDDIITDLSAKYGWSYSESSKKVYSGGLNIYLAIDPKIQNILEKYYLDSSNFPVHDDGTTAESAAIVIDPENGDILGVVGARGEKSANRILNLASKALRPTGSVIKPLSVYAPALDKNIITYASVYDDTPVRFIQTSASRYRAWPHNADYTYRGLTNINYALRYSTNTVAVKVLGELGTDESFDFLYNKLNMKSLIDKTDKAGNSDRQASALALGQMCYGVTLREVTAAYSIFPSGGYYNGYRSYYKVTDSDGNVLLSKDSPHTRAIGSDTACIMTEMLKNVVSNGTAHNITIDSYVDCAAKTGTTQNDCDKWMIGYTPYYICGVWYGYEYPRTLTGLRSNPCVGIWDDLMDEAHSKYKTDENIRRFEIDSNVVKAEYCVDSGKLMTSACLEDPRGDRSQVGYFKKNTVPVKCCDRHISVAYDTVHGGVATYECDPRNIDYVGLLYVERSFPTQIYITDAQYTWRPTLPQNYSAEGGYAFFSNELKSGEYAGISSVDVQYNRGCDCHGAYEAPENESGQNDTDDADNIESKPPDSEEIADHDNTRQPPETEYHESHGNDIFGNDDDFFGFYRKYEKYRRYTEP